MKRIKAPWWVLRVWHHVSGHMVVIPAYLFPHTVFVLWLLSIHYLRVWHPVFQLDRLRLASHSAGRAERGRRRRKRRERKERLWMGLQGLTSAYFLSFPLRSVCVCVCAVCACVCVPGRGVILQFPPAAETGDAALGPWWSHSEAFKAQHGSYLKQRGFPSALSRFPEIGQSGEISQFRDVLTFCDVFLLCFTERWERID